MENSLNNKINELYKTIEAQDYIINQQALEKASLKEEIKELNDDNAWWQRRFNAEHRIAFEEFKPRIDKAIEYIKKYDVFKEFTFPLMKRNEENQVKSSIDYQFKNDLKKNLLEILGDKENE